MNNGVEKRLGAVTPDQYRAITERGHSLAVSAAAGSGKTMVLTKRVLEYVLSGGSLDRLLVVTFTRAATAEMRERISLAIREALLEDPENRHLREQSIKIYSASISTIDSFQMDLVKEYFSVVGVAPSFSVYAETEIKTLFNSVMREVLDDYYATYPEGFEELTGLFGGEGENEGLDNAVRELFDRSENIPFAEEWMKKSIASYEDPSVWIDGMCEELLEFFADYKKALSVIREDVGCGSAQSVAAIEYGAVTDIMASLEKGEWDEVCEKVAQYPHKAFRANNSELNSVRLRELRAVAAGILESDIFLMSSESVREDALRQLPAVRVLFDIVSDIRKRMRAEFDRVGKYSFAEISRLAFGLVISEISEDGKSFTRTDAAKEICKRYDEILIDEYQDVNDMQSLFFDAISENDLFTVGDLKQCIYAFRGSNPENFLRKCETTETVYLNMNFRSRNEVIKSCNRIFSRLFSSGVGGVEYGDNEALHCGVDREFCEKNVTDIDLLYDPAKSFTLFEHVAYRIDRMLKEGFPVYERNGTVRPIRPSDIAVFIRKWDKAEEYAFALNSLGIPAFSQKTGSFFDSKAVSDVLALLEIIADPYVDLSLFIAMRSPLFNFTDEELARIRITRKKGRFFAAVKEYAATDEKTAAFVSELEDLNILARNMTVHDLLWEIFVRKEYLEKLSLSDRSGVARENALKLYTFAKDFDSSFAGGLSDFNSYTENAKAYGSNVESAAPEGDFVKIMTIHASKGLEYPVCFVCENDARKRSESRKLLVDGKYGVGMKIRDENGVYETTTLMFEAAALRLRKIEASENLRVLYVAATRAREKLIFCGNISRSKNALTELRKLSVFGVNGKILPTVLRENPTIMKPVLFAVSDSAELSELFFFGGEDRSELPFNVNIIDHVKDVDLDGDEAERLVTGLSEEEKESILNYTYPIPLSHIPAKVSVTELVKSFVPDEESEIMYEPERIARLPEFMREKQELTGAERGTAIHRFMSYADFSLPVVQAKEKLRFEGIMTEEELACVDERLLIPFLSSELFEAVKKSDRIYREKAFVISVPAEMYDKSAEGADEAVLVQGAIDLLCEDSEGFTVIDYKSDRNVTEQSLIDRYEPQLAYYAFAVSELFNKPVKRVCIWSFELGKAIELNVRDLTRRLRNDKI